MSTYFFFFFCKLYSVLIGLIGCFPHGITNQTCFTATPTWQCPVETSKAEGAENPYAQQKLSAVWMWAVIYWALKRQIRELLLITICPGLLYWQMRHMSEGKDQLSCAYLNEVNHVQAWQRWERLQDRIKYWLDNPLTHRKTEIML